MKVFITLTGLVVSLRYEGMIEEWRNPLLDQRHILFQSRKHRINIESYTIPEIWYDTVDQTMVVNLPGAVKEFDSIEVHHYNHFAKQLFDCLVENFKDLAIGRNDLEIITNEN